MITYNEYLVNTVNTVIEKYKDTDKIERLKSIIVEINSTPTHDVVKLNLIAEELDYLI